MTRNQKIIAGCLGGVALSLLIVRISMMVNDKFDDRERVLIREQNRTDKYATLSRWSSFHIGLIILIVFAKGFPLKCDLMGPVKNSVQDRVGDGRLLQVFMPSVQRQSILPLDDN